MTPDRHDKTQKSRHIVLSFDGGRRESGLGAAALILWLGDEYGSFEKVSFGGRVPRNASAMTAERVALRMGIEHLTVLFPTEVSSFDFQVECTDRTVTYKLNAQSLRLFGLHRDVNDAHRASANRLQNKNKLRPKISSDVPRDASRNWKQSAQPNQSCSRRRGSGCGIWRPPAVQKNRQLRLHQPPRWIWVPTCRLCSRWSPNYRKSGMRWPRKSRAALWRDLECVNGCRRHTSQKMSSHQCPRWSHESSQSGWRTVSQICKRRRLPGT